jgi:hypothetical protein
MSYDRNIYVGWYAEFDRCTDRQQDGVESKRACPTSKKHPTNGKFCSVCGAEIISQEIPKYHSYAYPHHLIDETDPVELEYATLGRATLEDVKKLQTSHVVFPEFLDTDKVIIMAPGYTTVGDVSCSDGSVNPVDVGLGPSIEWQENVIKVFSAKNMKINFGVIVEVV